MIASHRQARPTMPKNYCPFCPGSGKVPDDYTVYKYDNDFPALSQNPPTPDNITGGCGLYKTLEAYGKCEVILFSPDHNSSLCQFEITHLRKIVDLWEERFIEISKDEKIKYVFVFENRGAMVGVTMQHPHGQIYGYSYLPKKIELEVDNFKEHYEKNGECMFCAINKAEAEFEQRLVYENDNFYAYIPFFAEYPYNIYISPKNHIPNIAAFNDKEKDDLARSLKMVTGMYDTLFDEQFPYMMCMYNSPVNVSNQVAIDSSFHFRVEFYPPLRSKGVQKFNASSETGVWAYCNPTSPEEKAAEMRVALEKFIEKQNKG